MNRAEHHRAEGKTLHRDSRDKNSQGSEPHQQRCPDPSDLIPQWHEIQRYTAGLNVLWGAVFTLWKCEHEAYGGLRQHTISRLCDVGDLLTTHLEEKLQSLYKASGVEAAEAALLDKAITYLEEDRDKRESKTTRDEGAPQEKRP